MVGTGEGADCLLLKNAVDHSVKHVDESLPALLEKSGKSQEISCGLESGHPEDHSNCSVCNSEVEMVGMQESCRLCLLLTHYNC